MNMHLHAASIGEAIPRQNFDAAVHSAFDRAVNLHLEREDRLLTLLISDHYELPQGIRIEHKDLSLKSVQTGVPAACRSGVLRLDASPLTVDLRQARVWKCQVAELRADMRSQTAVRAWNEVWRMLNRRQRLNNTEVIADLLFQTDAGPALTRRLSAPMLGLISAAEACDVAGAAQAAEKMIGLGPGATPAGDDLLIGFLAGLWSMSADNRAQLTFIKEWGLVLVEIARETNLISRTYLRHAVRAQFSSSLSTLAEAIALGAGNLKMAAQAAMRVGHSSGMDSVTGMLMALSIWRSDPRLRETLMTAGKLES